MAVASLCGGLALANAGLGAVHGLAGPLGGMFVAPHGALCAALLGPVLAANLEALNAREPGNPARSRADQVARWLTGSGDAVAGDGVEWVARLTAELRIPRLSSWGVAPSDIGPIVEQAARSSSMKGNPVTLATEELGSALARAL
jgi:alcohol dehydrogenase class IV